MKKLVNIIFIVTFFLALIHGAESNESTRVLKVGYADCDPIFQDEAGNYSGYGVSYLEEVLFSFGAAVLYGINFLISICSCIVTAKKSI